jgi:hypothetical protein
MAVASMRHPGWKWGPFKHLSEYAGHKPLFDALEGALPSSASCELLGVWYGDIFHAASAEELLRDLTATLDRFRQLAPSHTPWEGRYASLVQFLRSVSHSSSSRSVYLGPFEPEDSTIAHMGRCWVSLFQPIPSLIVLSIFCVPSASERKAAADVLQRPLEQDVEWRLVFRPRFQVVPMWTSIRNTRQRETHVVEETFSGPIANAFGSPASLLANRPTIPCWSVQYPGHPLLSGKRRWAYEALLEPAGGMWCSDSMVFGFGENPSLKWFEPTDSRPPRLVIDRGVFERTERIDIYGGDVSEAMQYQLAWDRLPGLGAALAVKALTDELLPLSRKLHHRAYRATAHTSRTMERVDVRDLSRMLQRLLPRVAELRAVAASALDGASRKSNLDGFVMHPACPHTQGGSLLDAIKRDAAQNLDEVERVTLVGKELAGMAAADAAQHSATQTNLAVGALTLVLTLLGVISLCLQVGQPIGVAALVGVCVPLELGLLYCVIRLVTAGRDKRKND